MRRALLATSAIVAFALATYACGGDDDTNSSIPNNDAGGSSSGKTSSSGGSSSTSSGSTSSGSTSSGSTSSGSTSSGSTSSGSTSSGSTSSGGNTSSGGVPPVDDAGTLKDGSTITDSGMPDANESDGSAGSLCQVGSIQESEPNNGSGNADEITGDHAKFCGNLKLTDEDDITFTLPIDAATLSLAIDSTNSILVEGSVDGGPSFALTGQDAGSSIPFVPGGKYLLTARNSNILTSTDYIMQLDITRSPKSSKCEASSQAEVEDNGTTPNTMNITGSDSSFCGTINTTTDTDKFVFLMPSGKTSFSIPYSTTGSGFKLVLEIEGEAQSIELSDGKPHNDIPYKEGKKYTLTATSTTANNGYVVHLTTTP